MGEEYETPQVHEQSVEEMLSEAQGAVDEVFKEFRKVEAEVGDLEAVVSTLGERLEELDKAMAEAERLVQKVTYVAQVKGEHDVESGDEGAADQPG